MKKPILLMILDGWGYNESKEHNAVFTAKTPNLDSYVDMYPSTFIKCSGLDVGLPKGVMGNSEVGHLNIGAGRIVYQDLTRIDKAIEDGYFFSNEKILEAFNVARSNNKKIHLIGLLSDGGVHSHISHLEALIKLASKVGNKDVYVHPFFDGRDTAPKIGHKYLERLNEIFKEYGVGKIGSMSGRYYAMDRDKRWDRVKRSYDAMVLGQPFCSKEPIDYLKESYASDIGDEFIEPACFNGNSVIDDGDVVFFFNFRADRAREISAALTDPSFAGFNRSKFPRISFFLCMTEYDPKLGLQVAFPKQSLKNILGEVVSDNGLNQLRIAETEKYAHVTFFFNGGVEKPFKNEDRILIDSPRDVATYDLKPEMSATDVTKRLLEELEKGYYDFIVVNYANCDMVGHTGNFNAAVKAVETVDKCASQVVASVINKGGTVFLTADHGNAEKMEEDGAPHTAHTSGDVRLVVINKNIKKGLVKLKNGRLADIMPTILRYMGIDIPGEVTGEDLIIKS